jgi:hypothetical protein
MFRFTIRDVLWLMVVVAMGAAWWLDVRRRDSSIEAARLRLEEAELRADLARSETITVLLSARDSRSKFKTLAWHCNVNKQRPT